MRKETHREERKKNPQKRGYYEKKNSQGVKKKRNVFKEKKRERGEEN